jgi:hypothetical protein
LLLNATEPEIQITRFPFNEKDPIYNRVVHCDQLISRGCEWSRATLRRFRSKSLFETDTFGIMGDSHMIGPSKAEVKVLHITFELQ